MGQAMRCMRCDETTEDGAAHYRDAHSVTKVPLDEWTKAVAEGFPPFTSAQRDRLALLLRDRSHESDEPDHVVPVGASVLAEMLGE